jgi:predicted thioesterase
MNFKARTADASLQVSSPKHLHGTAEATSLSPEDGFRAVLATSRMIELMELAALRLMKPLLADGQSSVGVAMEVTFAAPSVSRNPGGKVRAVAGFRGVAGRVYRFTIHAFDESGLIGSAEHTRAVVNERRLLAVARHRARKAEHVADGLKATRSPGQAACCS